jgi:hypothetical protein
VRTLGRDPAGVVNGCSRRVLHQQTLPRRQIVGLAQPAAWQSAAHCSVNSSSAISVSSHQASCLCALGRWGFTARVSRRVASSGRRKLGGGLTGGGLAGGGLTDPPAAACQCWVVRMFSTACACIHRCKRDEHSIWRGLKDLGALYCSTANAVLPGDSVFLQFF